MNLANKVRLFYGFNFWSNPLSVVCKYIDLAMADWIDKKNLQKLMETRELETLEKLGGIEGIMTGLKTSPNGIDNNDVQAEKREELFAHTILFSLHFHICFFG